MKKYDCFVIGGGPAGMTAALYLLRSGVTVAMAEKLTPGGQVLQTEEVENYPGFPKGVKGYELADVFAEHLEGYELDRYSEPVTSLQHAHGANKLKVGDQEIIARSVIICTGARYKKLGLPNEEFLTGKGVSYCALCDGNFFRNQTVAVVGGGNSALEESLYLAKLVKKLYLIHRREGFRAAKYYQEKIKASPIIEVVKNTIVKELHGENGLTGVLVKNLKTEEEQVLPVDGLFVFVGYEPNKELLPDGLQTDETGFILTDIEMRTNLPGIFASGDCRAKQCRQVTTAVGDGATAANSAFLYLEQLNA